MKNVGWGSFLVQVNLNTFFLYYSDSFREIAKREVMVRMSQWTLKRIEKVEIQKNQSVADPVVNHSIQQQDAEKVLLPLLEKIFPMKRIGRWNVSFLIERSFSSAEVMLVEYVWWPYYFNIKFHTISTCYPNILFHTISLTYYFTNILVKVFH